MLDNVFIDFDIFPSVGTIAKAVVIVLDLLFLDQIFQMLISHIKTDMSLILSANIKCVKCHEHFKSNGATPVVCTQ